MFSIASEAYLRLALWAGIGASLFTIAITCLIVAVRMQRYLRERHEQRFRELWWPILMLTVAEAPPAALPTLARADHWLFIKMWNQLQETLRGEASGRLAALAERLQCERIALRMLGSRNLTRRLFAILTLGHMRALAGWDPLVGQLNQPGRTSSLYAARALIQIELREGVRLVVPRLLQRDDWEMSRIAFLLQEYRETLGAELLQHLPATPLQRLPRALQLAEALHLHVSPDLMLPWLDPGQPAALLRAALRLANGSEVLPFVRELARHPDWGVRVQAAHTLGRVGQPEDVATLTAMLSDPQWWVRYRAAGALVNLPFVSRAQLRASIADLQDRYAREIFTQVFAEMMDAYV